MVGSAGARVFSPNFKLGAMYSFEVFLYKVFESVPLFLSLLLFSSPALFTKLKVSGGQLPLQ